MISNNAIDLRVRELQGARFKEYEQELLRRKAQTESGLKVQKVREKRRRDFMAAMLGKDPKEVEAEIEKEKQAQEDELKTFLADFRHKSAGRPVLSAADAKEAAIRAELLAGAGHLVLPVFASTIFASDKTQFTGIAGLDWSNGAIDSGWVFPDDPSKIRIKDTRHYPNALCWDNRPDSPPEFAVNFGFIPAETATYDMTAVIAFHGFYALNCDDSWWNCREASVKLTVQMNVHQYVDMGWKDFPALIDKAESNTNEVDNYDKTNFFDSTLGLRAGDPVVVTVKGVVEASAHGGGAYAELNFADGTANYIEPLFLSVHQV